MGRRGKGELTYKQHEDAVKRKLYEQKKEIEKNIRLFNPGPKEKASLFGCLFHSYGLKFRKI